MEKDFSRQLNKSRFDRPLSAKTHNFSWSNNPADWSDIRKDCPANGIALYAGHKADYSSYDNLGFTVTCSGGYNVFIDGTQYGTTYTSGAQCSITWSELALATGDTITTPVTLTAHKIWICPATEGENITKYEGFRVYNPSTLYREQQGVLWAHFNIVNTINLRGSFASYNKFYNPRMLAITAKNNLIKVSGFNNLTGMGTDAYNYANNVEYTPVFDLQGNTLSGEGAFNVLTTAKLKAIILKNGTCSLHCLSSNATNLEEINTSNLSFYVASTNYSPRTFLNNYKLKKIPDADYTSATRLDDYIVNAESLEDTILDVSTATGLRKIGCYGSSQHFMSGFKGLRVSSSAPFDVATSPQINVSYTGMDRTALVQLFNDLPTVSDGQIINITGTTGASDLTADDELIATDKGWDITK